MTLPTSNNSNQPVASEDEPEMDHEEEMREDQGAEQDQPTSSEDKARRLRLAETAPLEPLPEKPHDIPLHQVAGRNLAPGGTLLSLQAARASAIGHVRSRNEDASLCFVAQSEGFEPTPPLGLFIIADGMGGHFDGHLASQVVTRTVAEHVLRTLYLPLLRGDAGISRRPVQEVMQEAVELANKALYTPSPDKQMGTTLTAALIIGGRAFFVHIGDSRAYLLHGDAFVQLTTDHTIVQALQDAGQLTAEEAATHPNRNLLYRALVGEELEQIDTFSRSLPETGTLLLCSDGLWGLVSDAEMKAVLEEENSLQGKADILVEKALAAGGSDNITAVLVGFQT
jgi:PPM family protein phosphatase